MIDGEKGHFLASSVISFGICLSLRNGLKIRGLHSDWVEHRFRDKLIVGLLSILFDKVTGHCPTRVAIGIAGSRLPPYFKCLHVLFQHLP